MVMRRYDINDWYERIYKLLTAKKAEPLLISLEYDPVDDIVKAGRITLRVDRKHLGRLVQASIDGRGIAVVAADGKPT